MSQEEKNKISEAEKEKMQQEIKDAKKNGIPYSNEKLDFSNLAPKKTKKPF